MAISWKNAPSYDSYSTETHFQRNKKYDLYTNGTSYAYNSVFFTNCTEISGIRHVSSEYLVFSVTVIVLPTLRSCL